LSPDIEGVSFEDYLRLEHIARSLFGEAFGTKIREEGEETEEEIDVIENEE